MNRVAVQREAELRRGGARVEAQRHAGNFEGRKCDSVDRRTRRIDRDVAQVIEEDAGGELSSAGPEDRGPAIQRGIARQARQSTGVLLRLLGRRMQQE